MQFMPLSSEMVHTSTEVQSALRITDMRTEGELKLSR